MIKIDIPGRNSLIINHLVLDYNGTIAVDGRLIEGLPERIIRLKEQVNVYVLTADTYGTVREQCQSLGIEVKTFPRSGAGQCKKEIVESLGGGVCCMGNGFNDIPMFDCAELSIAVMDREGMCAGLLSHADVLVSSPLDGLDLLLKPSRLIATLRS